MAVRHAELEEEVSSLPFSAARMKELARLGELVEVHASLQAKGKNADELREMAADGSVEAELRGLAREELEECERGLEQERERLLTLLVPPDPRDDKDVLLEVRAGVGGLEAGLFTEEMYEMYIKLARRRGWKVQEHERAEFASGGVREAVALISGEGVYRELRGEGGVHRVQRVPATETLGRVHTSTATVVVLPTAEEQEVEFKESDVVVETFRAAGAGGQHVNTTDSAVRLTHKPTGIKVSCQDQRSQHQNKASAYRMLQQRVAAFSAERAQQEQRELRGQLSGTGERSERIRTYNFADDRVTDHRLGMSKFGMQRMLTGDMVDEFISELVDHETMKRISEFVSGLSESK